MLKLLIIAYMDAHCDIRTGFGIQSRLVIIVGVIFILYVTITNGIFNLILII